MIRIAIIFYTICIIESQQYTFSLEELNELRNLFNHSESQMEEATRDQRGNAAIVLGAARCGKSTLINYLMGNPLEANWLDLYNIKIRKFDNSSRGPEIGAGSLSKTSIPSKWNSKRPELQNLDIWDSAGFDDTRGPMQDVSNSFHLYHLARKVENLKFILVIDFNDIQRDGTTPIEKILNTLEKYFTNKFRIFFPSISVIISKTPKFDDDNNEINHIYISRQLQEKLLSNPILSINNVSKDFIRHIIDDNQSLAIFRAAEEEGNITSEIDVNIFPTIINSKRIIKSCHQDVGVPISEDSIRCMQNSTDILLHIDEIKLQSTLFKSFLDKFETYCQSNDTDTLQTNKAELESINERLNTAFSNNPDAEVKIRFLETMSDDFKKFIKDEDVLNKISLTKFTDFILRVDRMSEINTPVNILLESLKVKIQPLLSLCSRKLNEITENEFKNKQDEFEKSVKEFMTNVNYAILKLNTPEEQNENWERFQACIVFFIKGDRHLYVLRCGYIIKSKTR